MRNLSYFNQSPIKFVSDQKFGKPPVGKCRTRNDSSPDVRRVIFDRLLSTAATSMFGNEDYCVLDGEQNPSRKMKLFDEHDSEISDILPLFSKNNENACRLTPKMIRKVTFSESIIIGSSSGYSPSCSMSIKLSHQQQPSGITDMQHISVEDVEKEKMRTGGFSHSSKSRGEPFTNFFELHHGNLNSFSMDQTPLTSLCQPNREAINPDPLDCNGQERNFFTTDDLYQDGVSESRTLNTSQQNLGSCDSSDKHPAEKIFHNSHDSFDTAQLYSDDEFLKYIAFLRQVHKKRASAMIQLLGAGLTERTEDIKGYYYDGMDTDELEGQIFTKVVKFMNRNRCLSTEMQRIVLHFMLVGVISLLLCHQENKTLHLIYHSMAIFR